MAPKRRTLLTVLIFIILIPVLVVVVVIQPFFIKSFILPRVETATQSSIKVDELAFSPLKHLSLTGVHFSLNDGSMDAKIPKVVVRYDLIEILKGTLTVQEITLDSPEITLVKGSTSEKSGKESQGESQTAETPKLNIENIKITNGRFTFIQSDRELSLTEIDLVIPEVINGKPLHPALSFNLLGKTTGVNTVQKVSGHLETKAEITLNDNLFPIGFKGDLSAHLEPTQAAIPAMDIRLNMDIGFDPDKKQIRLSQLSASMLQGASSLLTLDLAQPTQIDISTQPPTFSDTQISLYLPPVNLQTLPFSEWIPFHSDSIYLNSQINVRQSGQQVTASLDVGMEKVSLFIAPDAKPQRVDELTGKANVSWTKGQPSAVSVRLNAKGIHPGSDKKVPSPLSVIANGTVTSTKASLEKLEVTWEPTSSFENTLRLNGNMQWETPQQLAAIIYLEGNRIDLNPWSDWLSAGTAEPSGSDQTETGSPASVNQKIELPTLPFERVVVNADIKEVRLNANRLQDLLLKMEAGATSLDIRPLSLRLNGSTLTSSLESDWAKELRVAMKTSLSPLDLQPVMDGLLPEKKGAVTGILKADTDFRINGSSRKELLESFAGLVDISYTEGKVKLIDPDPDPEQHTALLHTRELVKDILKAVANTLQLSPEQLMAPEIESIRFISRISDNVVSLDKVELLNPEVLMRASGQISIKDTFERSSIDSLPLVLGLSTNLAKRVKIYRQDRVQGDYVILPSFLTVDGVLSEPAIEVKKGVITGLILSGVTEKNQVGNENVQMGLDLLGSLLTGEAVPEKPTSPAPTPQPGMPPAPTPKPGKTERVLEGIQLFNQLRATPTPKPAQNP